MFPPDAKTQERVTGKQEKESGEGTRRDGVSGLRKEVLRCV
jgi:hypothetical protein